MYRAWRHILDDYVFSDHRWLMITWMLGTVFLIIQGFEWIRLIGYGLNATANLYGAMFYIIIGAHGLHVFVAVQALLIVWRRALRGLYTRRRHNGVVLAGLFWGFVALIWPVLFVFVYL
jgi:heme/copper-type cytochrome/quinol oxidase subunit 3